MGKMGGAGGKQSFANCFQVFAKERQSVSTQRIQEETGLSLPSISRILNTMIQQGIVIHTDQSKGKVGRAQKLYSLNPEYRYVVGIYIDKAYTYVSIGNFWGGVLATVQIQTKNETAPLLPRIFKEVDCLLASTLQGDGGNVQLGSIGICVSAMVVEKDGETRVFAADIVDIGNIDIKKQFEERYHIDVFVQRDTNASLISRLNEKRSENYRNVALFNIGSGIGCAMAMDGNILRGANGFAGEVRNMLTCGSELNLRFLLNHDRKQNEPSSLERMYSTQNVIENAYAIYLISEDFRREFEESGFGRLQSREDMTIVQLDTLARGGSETCISLLYEPIRCWASIIVNFCCCMDPEAVFIGGQLGVRTPYIFSHIETIITQYLSLPIAVIALENDVLIRKAAYDYTLVRLYDTIRNRYLTDDVFSAANGEK